MYNQALLSALKTAPYLRPALALFQLLVGQATECCADLTENSFANLGNTRYRHYRSESLSHQKVRASVQTDKILRRKEKD